jgi:hypothetical protein
MKTIIIILFLSLNIISIAHEQHVHQYLTRESYLLLKSIYGDIPVMVDHVGTTQQGSGPWTSPYLVTGAYREDEEDVVYNFSGFGGIYTTGTHFWIADNGENSDVTLKWTWEGVYAQKTFPSAYTKFLRYGYGDWSIAISLGIDDMPLPNGGNSAYVNAVFRLTYNSLADLYVNKNIYVKDVTFQDGTVYYNPPMRLENWFLTNTTIEELANKFTWEILGRMCHLLQDMSVPAHAHGDAHGECDNGVRHDTYEKWVGSTVSPYNSPYLAISHNGMNSFLNPSGTDKPLYFLMYRVQQVADHFGSNGPYNGDGNDYLPVTSPSYYNIPLYTLPTSPTSINDFLSCCHDLANEPCYNREATSLQNRINIRDATLPLTISATAGLLYWFAVETGLITNIVVQNNFTGGTVKVNTVEKNSPYTYSNIVGLPLSLEAVTPQNGNDGYQHIWNNFATNARSLWQRLKGSSTYDILPPNSQHNFVTTQADNKSTYIAGLRKNYKIDVDHQTEFDGTQSKPPIWIVEQNNGQISAPLDTTVNGRTYKFAGWTDGNGDNPRTINNPTDNKTYTALYKLPQRSNVGAYSNNSQRKIVRSDDGKLHMVYESMGYVWYERSTNGGTTWQIMNGGKPIDSNPGRSPSIDVLYQQGNYITEVYIVYQTHASGSNDMAAIKVAYFVDDQVAGHQLQYINTADVGSVFYNEANYNPVVAKIYPGKVLVAWDGGYGIRYRIGTQISGGISWGVDTPAGNSSSAEKFPTIAAYKTYPNGIFHLAWQNSYSTINYCSFTFQQNGTFTVSSVTNVSQGCGYPTNYFPSINVSSSNQVYLVWIGCPYYNSSTRKTISRLKTTTWSSSFGQYGDKVLSPGAAFGGGNSIIAWSENPSTNTYTNKFLKYGSVKTAGTTGKDIQVFNADNLNNIFISSFNSNALPYYFSQSANLYSINKESSIAFASGVQAVAYNGKAEYYFRVGDISVNGTSVDFKDFEAPEAKIPINDLNKNLVTNEFPFNGNDKLTFSVEYGVTDSLLALSQLSDSKSISFKLELVDMSTGDAIMDINKFTLDEKNLASQVSNTYEYEVKGMEGKKVAIRVKLANNFKPDYATAVIKSDKNVLPKGSVICMDLTGTLTISDYALEQNYPNPFNPVTKISWQSPVGSHQTLKVFDVLGSEVTTLVNEWREAGRYSINFNGLDLPSGVYIYQLKVNDFVSSKKLILLK